VIYLRMLFGLLPRIPPDVNTMIFDNDSESTRVGAHCRLKK
jgi:hypothetical protein